MTLRRRITLTLAGVALAVSLGAAAAAYLSTAAQLRTAIDDTLTSRADAVNTTPGGRGRGPGGDDGPDGRDDADCPLPGSFQPAAAAQLVAPGGAVTVCIEGGPRLPVEGTGFRTITLSGQHYRVLSTPWHEGGTLQIARGLAESDALLHRLRLQLLLMVAVATAVPAAVGWVVATRLTRPIMRLRDTTEHIASTLDLSAPVPAGGSDEVGSLAASFATMVGAVARSQEQQRRLVSDASHEMRTPLTSLRSNVELLGRIERLPAAERVDVVDDVLQDIDELATLLAELVDLASDAAPDDPPEPLSLADLAHAVAARTERRTHRSVTVAAGTAGEVVGHSRQLERALANLLDNAVKYSPADTPVEIAVTGTTVTVRDHGRGIPDEDRERIFDRFYRAVDVRTEPGSGLGLSIVDEIVRGHGGRVFAATRPDRTTEVGFTLPAP